MILFLANKVVILSLSLCVCMCVCVWWGWGSYKFSYRVILKDSISGLGSQTGSVI